MPQRSLIMEQQRLGEENFAAAIRAGSSSGGMVMLHAGEHRWPFTFTLPHYLSPSSFQGERFKIEHLVRATLKRPDPDADLVCSLDFRYIDPVEIYDDGTSNLLLLM